MAKPKNAIPSVEKNISIPLDVCTKIELELYSEVEGKVPHGAWKRLITELLVKHLREQGKM